MKRATLLSLLVLFLTLCLVGAPECVAQVSPRRNPASETTPRAYSIRGMVRYSDNEAGAEMIKVELRRFTGEAVGITFSRNNGEFEFGGLSNGEYLVTISQQGYEPVRESVEIMGASRSGVFVYLHKPLVPSGEPEGPGATVSRHELSLPRKATSAFHKGLDRLYDKKDPAGSLDLFQRAANEAPSYYEAHHMMGVAYLQLGRTEEAEAAFRKSIEMSEQKFAEPFFGLAGLLASAEKFAEAATAARKGIELNPGPWNGHYELARALVGLNHLDDAEKAIEQARNRKPDFPDLYLLAANVHMRRKDTTALLKDLDEYLRLAPEGPMSAQARQMRETIQRDLARAQQNLPPAPPKQ